MADPNEQIELETNSARAASTPGVVRYILLISLVLIIAIFAAIILGR